LSYAELFGTSPAGPPNHGNGSGFELHDDGWYQFKAKTGTGEGRIDFLKNMSADQLTHFSVVNNYGPLMGRPDMQILAVPSSDEGRTRSDSSVVPKAAGLRFDCATGGMFWFWDQAPEDYKFAAKMVYVKQAQTDWDTA